MEPALTVSCGGELFTFDDDEHVALSEMNFLYGRLGVKIGRMLVARATLSAREVIQLKTFLEAVRAQLDEPLVVYSHGHGQGTVCLSNRRWYELVEKSGVRYQRDDVVYVRRHSVTRKNPSAKPQTLRDLPPLVSALEKLERVVDSALNGASVVASPRDTYEYF